MLLQREKTVRLSKRHSLIASLVPALGRRGRPRIIGLLLTAAIGRWITFRNPALDVAQFIIRR